MHSEEWIEEELLQLQAKELNRYLISYPEVGGKIRIGDRTYLNFSSNDYLDLSRHPQVMVESSRFLAKSGCGATASRLITGTMEAHSELESLVASLKGYPGALIFGSGFLTNIGVIPALVGKNDHIFSDKLVHASMVDACRLSRASLNLFHHNDVEHLRFLLEQIPSSGRRLIITESVFSMDGDIAPLPEIASVAVEHGAMIMVDEAHATGVFGPFGSGLIREYGLEDVVNISMGTFSKALGGYGGFVACSAAMRKWLINRARAFIYTTGLPPAVAGSAIGALKVIHQDEGMGARLLQNAAAFRKRLEEAGLDTGGSESQIVPIIVGSNRDALELAKKLEMKGILAVAIRPPTVPEGSSRLRLSITLAHTPEDLHWAADEIIAAIAEKRKS